MWVGWQSSIIGINIIWLLSYYFDPNFYDKIIFSFVSCYPPILQTLFWRFIIICWFKYFIFPLLLKFQILSCNSGILCVLSVGIQLGSGLFSRNTTFYCRMTKGKFWITRRKQFLGLLRQNLFSMFLLQYRYKGIYSGAELNQYFLQNSNY